MTTNLRAVLGLVAFTSIAGAQTSGVPKTGAEVLERMRAAYAGKWYSTLTFVQTTSIHRPTGVVNQTWYESLRFNDRGTYLRIDQGDLTAGNGTLYTADSSWRVRAGKVVSMTGEGNEFLPLIEGVYMQPVARTMREISPTKVDMGKVDAVLADGHRFWVVGATSSTDMKSPQFWVDADRNVVTRFILAPDSATILDVTLTGYERIGDAWLATHVLLSRNGDLLQEEKYADWKVNVPLPDALFDANQWTTAPHWAKSAKPPTLVPR